MDTGTVHKSHYMTQDWHISSHLKQFTEPWLKFISKVCLDHNLVGPLEEQIDIWDMSWHVWASAYVQYVCVYCIIACLCAHMAGYVDTKYAPSWCPNVLLHLYMVMAKSLSTSLRHGLEATFCKETLPELWKPLKCLFHWGETDISEASFLRVTKEGRSQVKRTFQRLHSWGLQMMCLTTNKQPGTRPAHSEGKHMQALNELSSSRCRGCCTVGIVSSLLTQTRYVVHVICLLSSPLEVYFCQWSCG